MQSDFQQLINKAQFAGASDVRIVPSSEIVVEQRLADICYEPRCKNYGLSMSCPPHVGGPKYFLKLIEQTSHAMIVRLDVPSEVLFSNERDEVMRLLHEIVASVEKLALEMGNVHSKGFAGGSCKIFFCADFSDCNVLAGKGKCRNPNGARQSMSGFGVNVGEMMVAADWDDKKVNITTPPSADETSWVAGLIMIG